MAKRSGSYYIDKACEGGCTSKQGRGDHVKLYSPKGYEPSMMVVPVNLKGNGTEHAIRKWLLKFGIVCVLIFMIYILVVLPIITA